MSSRISVDQILFPATANLSTNSNLLDHYDEGTFTPYYSSSGTTNPYDDNVFTGASYEAQEGFYVRIGGIVFWSLQIAMAGSVTLDNGGSGTNNLAVNINNIPHNEGKLLTDQDDPPGNPNKMWGNAVVNFWGNMATSGWSGYGWQVFGPTQYGSATNNSVRGVIYPYFMSTTTATSMLVSYIGASNQVLMSGHYFTAVNSFGSK